MKKITLFMFLVFVLATAASAAGGAKLVLQTKDGQTISGELLAVKHHQLILKDSWTSLGVTTSIEELESIWIKNESRVIAMVGLGVILGLVGGVVGVELGQPTDNEKQQEKTWDFGPNFNDLKPIATGFLGAIFGAGLGVVIGASTTPSKTIKIKEKNQEEIEKILKLLRSEALYEKESY